MIRLFREQPGPDVDCTATGVVRKVNGSDVLIQVEHDFLRRAPQPKCRSFWFEGRLDDMSFGDRVCVGFVCSGLAFEPQVRWVERNACVQDACNDPDAPIQTELTRLEIVRVIDGDTFEGRLDKEGPRTVPLGRPDPTRHITIRVAGIDTPESDECGFAEATQAAERLLRPHVWIDAGPDVVTSHSRLVATVFLDEARSERFGERMVREGWAHPVSDSPVSPGEAKTRSGGVWDLCGPAENPFAQER